MSEPPLMFTLTGPRVGGEVVEPDVAVAALDVDRAAQPRRRHFAALFHLDRRVALHARDLQRAGPADELDGADVLDLDFTAAMRDLDLSGNLPERRFAARALHLQACHVADLQRRGPGLDADLQAGRHLHLQDAALPAAAGELHAQDERRRGAVDDELRLLDVLASLGLVIAVRLDVHGRLDVLPLLADDFDLGDDADDAELVQVGR